MVLKPGTGRFDTVCRCQVLLGNEVSSRKHDGLWNVLVYGCVDQQMTWHPNRHWLWKLYTRPQATWILCLSSLPPDSGTLIFNGNAKFTFIREHNFGPVQSCLTLAQARRFWHSLMFNSGVTQIAAAETHVLHKSVCGGSWNTDSSCSPLSVNLPHILEWVWFHNSLFCCYPNCLYTFFYNFSFPSPLLKSSDTELCEQPASFCNVLLCLALLVQGVNGRLLDNCQIRLPHYCVAYRTRLRDHLKACACVLRIKKSFFVLV